MGALWTGAETDTAPTDQSQSDLPPERRTPSLRAEIFVLSDRKYWSAIESAIPGKISVRTFEDPEPFERELSGNVAVALLSTSLSTESLESVVNRTVARSEHARIGLIADDSAELLGSTPPHDEAVVTPVDREEFETLIKRLYIRAYYSVTLQRFYRITIDIRNRELQLQETQSEADDELRRLQTSKRITQSYLRQFRRYLEAEDFEAMRDREDRLQDLVEASKASPDPSALGLPKSCPNCSLDWTTWHGPRLRNGYERIGAKTWHCTDCGEVIADVDPNNYRIA